MTDIGTFTIFLRTLAEELRLRSETPVLDEATEYEESLWRPNQFFFSRIAKGLVQLIEDARSELSTRILFGDKSKTAEREAYQQARENAEYAASRTDLQNEETSKNYDSLSPEAQKLPVPLKPSIVHYFVKTEDAVALCGASLNDIIYEAQVENKKRPNKRPPFAFEYVSEITCQTCLDKIASDSVML